jgi:hypothetical protein
MGFSVPPRLRAERWALTPPFHPYPASEEAGRFVFCGTVRRQASRPRLPRVSGAPKHRLRGIAPYGVRTFLPRTSRERTSALPEFACNVGCCPAGFKPSKQSSTTRRRPREGSHRASSAAFHGHGAQWRNCLRMPLASSSCAMAMNPVGRGSCRAGSRRRERRPGGSLVRSRPGSWRGSQ